MMADHGRHASDWQIIYLGWSGFHFHRHDEPHIFIDPPKGTCFPQDAEITIFITHGHPEHLGGSLSHVRAASEAKRTTIVASETVCRYLRQQCRRGMIEFIPVTSGQKLDLPHDISFEVFAWQHMPLLPPGLGAAVRHITHIIRRFPAAWRIIRMSLKGPSGAGDMLGYLLRLSGNKNIIIYGEGMHRRCRAGDVAAIGDKMPGATLLVASEPEDLGKLPELVLATGAFEAILYEPHRPWRDIFDLPHTDLKTLQKAVMNKGVLAKISENASG